MFEVGHVYTHERMKDVCMLIVSSDNRGDFWALSVRWFLRTGSDMNARDDVRVKKDDVERWYEW